jgi:uncharacterized protein
MKLTLDKTAANLIRAYDAEGFLVGERRIARSLLIGASLLDETALPSESTSLSASHFATLAATGAEIVILGTGSIARFPPPALAQALYRCRIGLEVMDTGAACRTYNVLVTEGRHVVGALLFG